MDDDRLSFDPVFPFFSEEFRSGAVSVSGVAGRMVIGMGGGSTVFSESAVPFAIASFSAEGLLPSSDCRGVPSHNKVNLSSKKAMIL